jgi:hypothetical protein
MLPLGSSRTPTPNSNSPGHIPLRKGDWKEETAKNKIALIESDLLEDLGDIPLRNFTRYDLQMQVNKLAETRSRDRVLQMRAYLRDIFSEALDQDFLVKGSGTARESPGATQADRQNHPHLGAASHGP